MGAQTVLGFTVVIPPFWLHAHAFSFSYHCASRLYRIIGFHCLNNDVRFRFRTQLPFLLSVSLDGTRIKYPHFAVGD